MVVGSIISSSKPLPCRYEENIGSGGVQNFLAYSPSLVISCDLIRDGNDLSPRSRSSFQEQDPPHLAVAGGADQGNIGRRATSSPERLLFGETDWQDTVPLLV